jgi:hypothetical protein
LTSGCPPKQPTQSFKSSIAIKSTFGLFRAGGEAVPALRPAGILPAAGYKGKMPSPQITAPAAVSFRKLRRFITLDVWLIYLPPFNSL